MPHDQTEKLNREVRVRALGPVSEQSCVLILEELAGVRLLPIFASIPDGEAIARHVAGVAPPRPQTHDLLQKVVETLGWAVTKVLITEVKDGTFYAKIELSREGQSVTIDARPTDAVNVALRAHCPIFVVESVFSSGDSILKPIEESERARFKEDLDKLDLSKVFADLENKPAPLERGDRGTPADADDAALDAGSDASDPEDPEGLEA